MMRSIHRRLRRAIVAACAAVATIGVGAAQAAGVNAGSTVSNTFSVDYSVGGVPQAQVTPATPTTFTVDRLIDLTVTSLGDVNVTPGATAQRLVFGVRNEGNDNQAYSFSLADVAGDAFDVAPLTVTYFVDVGGDGIFTPGVDDVGGTSYTIGSGAPSTDLAPDATLWVVVSGDIPGTQVNGDNDGVTLVATTRNPVVSLDPLYSATAGAITVAAAGANNQNGEAQNVFADGAGVTDAANDGQFSATAQFIVSSASLSASKTVSVVATDGTAVDCASGAPLAGNQYATPGACIEYVITVENDASAAVAATDIDVSDTLPDEIDFVGAAQGGFSLAGTLTTPAPGCSASCVVSLTGAQLAVGASGSLTIRALVR